MRKYGVSFAKKKAAVTARAQGAVITKQAMRQGSTAPNT